MDETCLHSPFHSKKQNMSKNYNGTKNKLFFLSEPPFFSSKSIQHFLFLIIAQDFHPFLREKACSLSSYVCHIWPWAHFEKAWLLLVPLRFLVKSFSTKKRGQINSAFGENAHAIFSPFFAISSFQK